MSSDVRLLAATNRDLEADVKAGTFREDLYYRLNVIRIELPPLRERREDIPALVAHFLDKHRSALDAAPTRISEAAMQAVLAESWPGNVRQLENTIQRAVVLSGGRVIMPEHLDLAHAAPQAASAGPLGLDVAALVREAVPLKQVLADVERALIVEALRQAEGNRSEAARSLHVYRRLLYQKMEEYGVE